MQKKIKTKKLRTMQQRHDRLGYLFMLPWIIGFVIFTAIPFVITIYLSFSEVKQDVNGFNVKWIGLSNYQAAFLTNTEFTPALISFLGMIVPYSVVIVIMAFILAFLLNQITFLKSALRTIYFLPVIVLSGPVMYQLMDSSSSGGEEVKQVYDVFILDIIASYSPMAADLLIYIFENLSIILWFTGIPIILFINGLQKINPSLYEAAKIDSATGWQILWKITIPIIKPTALIAAIFTIAQLGALDSINPVLELIKTATANTSGGFGYAATYAWVYSLLVLSVIALAFLFLKEKKNTERHVI